MSLSLVATAPLRWTWCEIQAGNFWFVFKSLGRLVLHGLLPLKEKRRRLGVKTLAAIAIYFIFTIYDRESWVSVFSAYRFRGGRRWGS
jgi:hypothetical protein